LIIKVSILFINISLHENEMDISSGMKIINTGLFIKKEKILIINDLHIGYEQELHLKGILVPRFQLKSINEQIKHMLKKTKPNKVIINGDLKHVFGKILQREWKEVLEFLDLLLKNVKEIIIIKGNHDPIIKPIADKRNIKVVENYKIRDILIVHGDELIETNAKKIIIGHEHPAITIREGSKWEKYKCFLKGKWKGKELIAVPSFNPLVEGSDVLKEKLLSPYLKNIENFETYIISGEEVYDFGFIKAIKKHHGIK